MVVVGPAVVEVVDEVVVEVGWVVVGVVLVVVVVVTVVDTGASVVVGVEESPPQLTATSANVMTAMPTARVDPIVLIARTLQVDHSLRAHMKARSPARIGTGSQFSTGGSGQEYASS